jgi:hypothetical protein
MAWVRLRFDGGAPAVSHDNREVKIIWIPSVKLAACAELLFNASADFVSRIPSGWVFWRMLRPVVGGHNVAGSKSCVKATY